jgi:hypothetical protein
LAHARIADDEDVAAFELTQHLSLRLMVHTRCTGALTKVSLAAVGSRSAKQFVRASSNGHASSSQARTEALVPSTRACEYCESMQDVVPLCLPSMQFLG